jgi:hypothetical protein
MTEALSECRPAFHKESVHLAGSRAEEGIAPASCSNASI